MARTRKQESGFALLLVFLMSALIAISLYTQVPRVAFESQRAKEQMLIERGEQYKRAIQLFVRKFKRYPAKMEELENTNNIRFLRRRYTDPMTGKDEWRIINCGPNGVLTNSIHKKKDQNKKEGNSNTFIAEGPSIGATTQQTAVPSAAMRRRASDGGGTPGQPGSAGIGLIPGQPGDPAAMAAGQPNPQNPTGIPGQPGQPGDPNAPAQAGMPQPGVPGQPGFAAVPNQPGQPGMPGQPNIPGVPGQPPGVVIQPGTPGFPAGQNFPPNKQSFPQGQTGTVGGSSFIGGGSMFGGGQTAAQPGVPGAPVSNQPGGYPNQQGGFPYATTPGQQTAGPGYPQPGSQPQQNEAVRMIQSILTSPRPQGAPAASGSTGMGGQTVGGGIAGVASTLEQDSIMVYDEQYQKYNEWEFVYDMSKDRTGAGMGPGAVGTPADKLNSPASSNSQSSGFGSSSFGSQPSSFGSQPSGFGSQPSSFGSQPSTFGSQPNKP